MEQNKRRPGRPPEFERGDVVARAMQLFWSKGADASLDLVTVATGLHKPSLYAAFGGKRGLYLEALDSYLAEAGARTSEALSRESFRDALGAFFGADLEFFCGREGVRGCFLISTAIDAAAGDPAVRERVERVFSEMRAAMLSRVERAIAAGDLPRDISPDVITELIASTHIALSIEARSARPRSELEEKASRFVDFVMSLG